MACKCGIVGLPNVGKSSCFNALTKRQVLSANFPFATIDPNIGQVDVPDPRLKLLNQCVHAQKIVPSSISFVDIAGLVQGASRGEGLGNQFLGAIRGVDAIIHIVRCFDNDRITHVAGSVDPAFDQEVINEELRLADLAFLHRREQKLAKKAKAGQQAAVKETALLKRFIQVLEQGKDAASSPITQEDKLCIQAWQLLTQKPVIYIANIGEHDLHKTYNKHLERLKQAIGNNATRILPICIDLEAQIATLPVKEQKAFLNSYGIVDSSLDLLIQEAYSLLGLITYFTAGPQEVRAWTITKGTKAPQAAGVIHTDFETAFIKAEIIKMEDYLLFQTEEKCRQAGKVAVEGKNYVVQDGDVIYFRCKK